MKNVLVTIKNHPIKFACGMIIIAAFVGMFIKEPAKKEQIAK